MFDNQMNNINTRFEWGKKIERHVCYANNLKMKAI